MKQMEARSWPHKACLESRFRTLAGRVSTEWVSKARAKELKLHRCQDSESKAIQMTSAKDSASEIFTMLCVEELGWQCRTLECQPNMNNPGDKCKKQRSFQTPEPIGTPKPCAGPSGSNLKSSTSSPTAYALQGTMGTGGPKAVSGQLRELSMPSSGPIFSMGCGICGGSGKFHVRNCHYSHYRAFRRDCSKGSQRFSANTRFQELRLSLFC